MLISIVLGGFTFYLLLSLFFTYLVHRMPRRPVQDTPDWGKVLDTSIPACDGGSLEVWRIEPDSPSRGVVVLVHGWSRNRDRMVGRARVFAQLGFTAVIHSARDHGNSSPRRFMNAPRFAEDIEAVLNWVNEPVLLYGHSIGAVASIMAAGRNPDRIRLLFLEACYAETKEALRSLYRSYNWFFGVFFGPAVVFLMDIFYRWRLDSASPVRIAPRIDMPVLLIHGEKDQSFPLHHALRLKDSLPSGKAELFVAHGADHSGSSLDPGYAPAIRAFLERHLQDGLPASSELPLP